MASEHKLEALESEVVGEPRSLLCEGRLRVEMTRGGRWQLGELRSVREGEATPVEVFSSSTERVDLSRL